MNDSEGKSAAQYISAAIFVSLITLLSFAACELIVRSIDHYELIAWGLVVRQGPIGKVRPWEKSVELDRYGAAVPLAPGMRFEWFDDPPATLRRDPVDPTFVETYRRFAAAGVGSEAIDIFNSRYFSEQLCKLDVLKNPPGFVFIFDASNGTDRPRFRFARSVSTGTGLVTNQFGFRGPQIDFHKPPKTIRLAFLGSSTTFGRYDEDPFSYPELVVHWLNLWATQRNLDVRFEVINAGRGGIDTEDIAVIFRDEVLPLEPDLVVFDGATNAFSPAAIVRMPKTAVLQKSSNRGSNPLERWLYAHSAIARRIIDRMTPPTEPAKPAYDVVWPADIDEHDPPLDSPDLPARLTKVLADIEDIRARAISTGADFAISSLFLFAFDGMRIDPIVKRTLYDYLNIKYYPYRYREMERMATFQNRVLKKYAATHAALFLDFAAQVPHDPNLYRDGVHATFDGVRLQAWIVAQQLAPVIEKRVREGHLPRPAANALAQHPAFPDNERTMVFDCDPSTLRLLENVNLTDSWQAVPPATAKVGDVLTIDVGPESAPWRYAVTIRTAQSKYPGTKFVLAVEARGNGAEIGFGVLSPDQKAFLGHGAFTLPTDHFETVYVPFQAEDGSIGPVLVDNGSSPGKPASVQIKSIAIRAAKEPQKYTDGFAVPPTR